MVVFSKVPGWVRKADNESTVLTAQHFTYDEYAARKSTEFAARAMTEVENSLVLAGRY